MIHRDGPLTIGLAMACTAIAPCALASLMDGKTISTINYHGSQPDQTQIFGPVESLVGPGVELSNFGVTTFLHGEPVPGVYEIDFADNRITVALNGNMPFSYFEALLFQDADGVLPPFTEALINPATDYSGFNESDVYISPGGEYIEIFPPQGGLAGQQIVLDLPDPCPSDLDGDEQIGPADLASLLGAWGPADGIAEDVNDDGEVGPADLASLLGTWGACQQVPQPGVLPIVAGILAGIIIAGWFFYFRTSPRA